MPGRQQRQKVAANTHNRPIWTTYQSRGDHGLHFRLFGALLLALLSGFVKADDELARLTADVMRHSAKVHALEQELLHPADSRLAIFLSLASNAELELDSVELFLNQQPVTAHLYNATERDSLGQGGIHQLYLGNVADGEHRLKAVISARATNNRFVRREIVRRIVKQAGTLRLQMVLSAPAPEFEPELAIKTWD